MIHLRVNILPTLHVIVAYLDTAPTALEQARLKEKINQIADLREECQLIGDLNSNVDKSTEHPKTRLMQIWQGTAPE